MTQCGRNAEFSNFIVILQVAVTEIIAACFKNLTKHINMTLCGRNVEFSNFIVILQVSLLQSAKPLNLSGYYYVHHLFRR
jgi:hypothetical protein